MSEGDAATALELPTLSALIMALAAMPARRKKRRARNRLDLR
jgi:hypothetical protein